MPCDDSGVINRPPGHNRRSWGSCTTSAYWNGTAPQECSQEALGTLEPVPPCRTPDKHNRRSQGILEQTKGYQGP